MAKKLIGLRNYYVLLVMFLKKNNYVLEVNIMFLMQSVTTSKKTLFTLTTNGIFSFYTYYKSVLHLLQNLWTDKSNLLVNQVKVLNLVVYKNKKV